MAPSVLQTAEITNGSSGAFSSPVTAGSGILLLVGGYITSAVTASASNPSYNSGPSTGWTELIPGGVQAPFTTADGCFADAWFIPDVAGGGTSLSITTTNVTFNSALGAVAYEIAGLGTAPTVDGTGQSESSSASSATSGTVTTSQTTDIVAAMQVIASPAAGPPGLPWVSVTLADDGRLNAAYQVPGTAGPFSFGPTSIGAGTAYAGLAVALTPATAPPATPAVFVRPSVQRFAPAAAWQISGAVANYGWLPA